MLQLKGFRHPVSEALVDDYGEQPPFAVLRRTLRFSSVPNDICLGGDEARGVLLTGSK